MYRVVPWFIGFCDGTAMKKFVMPALINHPFDYHIT